MNDKNDDNYGYQEEDYGQDYYDESQQGFEAEGEYTEEAYDDSQLPVQEGRTFFQKYANLIIFGGVGIFVLVMGYVNFGHLLFPANDAAPKVTAAGLLEEPNYADATATPETTTSPDAPIIPSAPMNAEEQVPSDPAPVMNAMGVSPAAPVTNAVPDGGIALSPVAPVNPDDPWAEVATAPPVAAPADTPVVMPPAEPVAGEKAPAASATAPDAVAVPSAEAERLAEVQKKLAEAETVRAEQEAAIAELQNKLAEAEAKAAAPQKTESTETPAPAPVKPKPKKVVKAAPTQPVTSWELRSASDGMAWITKRGDNQLFRINVGDEVPGIGRVTAIREQGGQWVVVGTQGQIRQ
ncbi:MAG TPA: hypothetical protein PKW15_02055 [Alphaproteobacteria bacterium]|nr:hypothetical protein [Rhodospirillaceae bacterium]HRJ12007.1 hypothetical protein [Alphaproteobacteria bacterium]